MEGNSGRPRRRGHDPARAGERDHRSVVTRATIPAASASHGPMDEGPNDGGRSRCRTEPAITNPASTRSAATQRGRGERGRSATAPQIIRPTRAPIPASIDHRGVIAHAPRSPEPGPKRFHGMIEARAATANAMPVQGSGSLARVGCSGSRTRLGPRAAGRHSSPRTRPRTGTAHRTHIGRPQSAHSAITEAAGWRSQRFAAFADRSSNDTGEAYVAPAFASRPPARLACPRWTRAWRYSHRGRGPTFRHSWTTR